MQIDRKLIEAEFDKFFEFDTGDQSTVLSVSCRLFAEHIAGIAASKAREQCAELCGYIDRYRGEVFAQKIEGIDG